jgi:glyoxylase I family protein
MFKAFKFNHVAVNVTDVDKSREFYEKVIGLKKLPRPKINIPGEWHGVGESAIHLIGGERRTDGIDPTGPHIAIQVDDIDQTKASLNEMGVAYLDAAVMIAKLNLTPEQQKMVGRQVWVKDPDGNVIELQERTAE